MATFVRAVRLSGWRIGRRSRRSLIAAAAPRRHAERRPPPVRTHASSLRIALAAALLAGAVAGVTAATAADTSGDAFTVGGSAKQVYATGLPAGAHIALLDGT